MCEKRLETLIRLFASDQLTAADRCELNQLMTSPTVQRSLIAFLRSGHFSFERSDSDIDAPSTCAV